MLSDGPGPKTIRNLYSDCFNQSKSIEKCWGEFMAQIERIELAYEGPPLPDLIGNLVLHQPIRKNTSLFALMHETDNATTKESCKGIIEYVFKDGRNIEFIKMNIAFSIQKLAHAIQFQDHHPMEDLENIANNLVLLKNLTKNEHVFKNHIKEIYAYHPQNSNLTCELILHTILNTPEKHIEDISLFLQELEQSELLIAPELPNITKVKRPAKFERLEIENKAIPEELTNAEWLVKDIQKLGKPQNLDELEVAMPPITGLVCEGGGAKGTCYIGSTQALEELGAYDQLENVAGSSAGAMNAFAMAMGLSAEQLVKFLNEFNIIDLLDVDPLGGTTAQCTGKNIHTLYQYILEKVLGDPNASFADLEAHIKGDESRGIKPNPALKNLFVTMTPVGGTQKSIYAFAGNDETIIGKDKDAQAVSVRVKDLRIADAVRASMSIPPAYGPIEVRTKDGTSVGLFRDGGILNNLPLELLDDKDLVAKGYKTKKLGTVDLNPSVVAFKFITDIKKLNPNKTRFSDFIKKERKLAGIPDSARPDEIDDEEFNAGLFDIGVLGLAKVGLQATFGLQKTDLTAVKEKYKNHNNICELWTGGVGTFDFGVSSTPNFLKAVESGKLATYEWWDTQRKPDLVFNDKKQIEHLTKRKDLPYLLDQYLAEKARILKPARGYTKDEPSIRLKQLAAYINFITDKSPDLDLQNEMDMAINRLEERNQLLAAHHQKVDAAINSAKLLTELGNNLLQRNNDRQSFARGFHCLMSDAIDDFSKPLSNTGGLSLARLAAKTNKADELQSMLTTIKENLAQMQWWTTSFQTIKIKVSPDKGYLYNLDKNGKRQKTYREILNRQPLLHDAFEAMKKNDENQCLQLLLNDSEINLLRRPYEIEYSKYLSIFHHVFESQNENAFNMLLSAAKKQGIDLKTHKFADGKTLIQHFAQQPEVMNFYFKNEMDENEEFELTNRNSNIWEALVDPAAKSWEGLTFQDYKDQNINEIEVKEYTIDELKKISEQEFKHYFMTPNKHGFYPIHEAVMNDDEEKLTIILTKLYAFYGKEAATLLELKSSQGLGGTALYLAALHGRANLVSLLRYYDADVDNAGPDYSPSALTAAAKSMKFKCVEAIVASKPRASTLTGHKTISRKIPDYENQEALHVLTQKNPTTEEENEIIYKLLHQFTTTTAMWVPISTLPSSEYGLQMMTKAYDSYGKTPLHYIIENNNQALLNTLIEKGKGYKETWYTDTYFDLGALGPINSCAPRLTPVEYALSLKPPRLEIARLLRDNCYDKALKRQMDKAITKASTKQFKPDDTVTYHSFLLSNAPSPKEKFKLIRKALANGDSSPLIALNDQELKNKNILATMFDQKSRNNKNILYILVEHLNTKQAQDRKIVLDLIKNICSNDKNIRADIDGEMGKCALTLAAKMESWEAFAELYPYKKSRNTPKDSKGNTCLHYLAKNADPQLFCNFVCKAEKIDSKDNGHLYCYNLTDFNVRNKEGLTPLQMLILYDKVDTVKMLCEKLYTSKSLMGYYYQNNLLSTLIGAEKIDSDLINYINENASSEMRDEFVKMLKLENVQNAKLIQALENAELNPSNKRKRDM